MRGSANTSCCGGVPASPPRGRQLRMPSSLRTKPLSKGSREISGGLSSTSTGFERINEPAQLGAIGQILLHFLLRGGEPIRPGPQLHHEVRADRSEVVLLFIGQGVPALVPNPGDVRRAFGAV